MAMVGEKWLLIAVYITANNYKKSKLSFRRMEFKSGSEGVS